MKKNYIQPSVEATQLMPSTVVLAGSPNDSIVIGDPVEDLGGD